MHYLQVCIAVLYKDILIEWRGRETLTVMIFFSVVIVLIFHFALNPTNTQMQKMVSGLLWIAYTFSGILGLNRNFALEQTRKSMMGLTMVPVDRGAIFLGKVAAIFLFMSSMQVLLLGIVSVLYNLTIQHIFWKLLGVQVLGTIGFSAVGVLLSGIALNTRLREILLPLLLFPVIIPVVLAAVEATSSLFLTGEFGSALQWIRLLVFFDVLFVVVSTWVFEYVVIE